MDILEALNDAHARGVAPPQNWVSRAADEIERLRAALQHVIDTLPAVGQDGGLFIEHCDCDGNPVGYESVDPMAVVSEMVDIAMRAISLVRPNG